MKKDHPKKVIELKEAIEERTSMVTYKGKIYTLQTVGFDPSPVIKVTHDGERVSDVLAEEILRAVSEHNWKVFKGKIDGEQV